MTTPSFSPYRISKLFDYERLPLERQAIGKKFHDMAVWLHENLPHDPETSVALRKLWESKNSAVAATVVTEAPPVNDT